MADPINTSTMPGDNMNPEAIESAAGKIRGVGSNVSTTGGNVAKAWAGLKKGYHAPEEGTLFGAIQPAKKAATDFGTDMGKVATALETFAGEVRTIKSNVAKIRSDAATFLGKIHDGKVTVSHTVVSGGYAGYERGQTTTSHEDVDWNSDQATVDENNALIRRTNDQQEQLWAAERKCANAIRDVYHAAHISAASESNPNGYGVTDIPDNAETPWGKTVERKEGCGEKVVKGVFVDGLGGMAEGITSLVGFSWSGPDGAGFSWSTAGHAWNGLAHLATGGPLFYPLALLPGPVGGYIRTSIKTNINFVPGLVGIDVFAKDPFAKWKDDPARTFGSSLFNVGSLFIPVGGEVSAGGKAVAGGAKAVEGASDVAKGSRGLEGLGDVAKVTGEGADLTKIAGGAGKTELGNLGKVTDDLGDGLKGLEKTDIDVPNVPHDRVTVDHPNVGEHGPGDIPPARDPGAHEPGVHEPGAHEPGAHEPGAHEPGAHEPGDPNAHDPGDPNDPNAHDPGDPNDPNAHDPNEPADPNAHDHSGYDKDGIWHYEEKGDPTWTNKQKGEYGERASDAYMQAHRFERVDVQHPSVSQNGIDAIYKDPATGKYAIVESKWGKNSLSMTQDGRQMSDSWLRGSIGGASRIQNAVGGDARLAAQITRGLRDGNVEKFVANVYQDGGVHLSILGADGSKLGAVDLH
jgi:hypothetical protein